MRNIIRNFILVIFAAFLFQGCSTPVVNKPADALFKDGEDFFQKGNYEDAIAQWKRVKESYQSPELMAKAEIGIADAYFLNNDYIEAAAEYESFRKLHPNHLRAGYALYRQGMSHFQQIKGIDTEQTPVKNARTIFESYIKLYAGGEFMGEVVEKIRDCKNKQLQYEIYVGRFYLYDQSYPAAIARFEEALKDFSDQSGRDEALYLLGRACLEAGQKTKGREIFGRLSREFPDSRFVSDANKAMDKYF